MRPTTTNDDFSSVVFLFEPTRDNVVVPFPRDIVGPVRVYKLFLCHAWEYDDDYDRLVRLLNNSVGFHWRNLSVPSNDRIHEAVGQREISEALVHYIRQADCVLICAGMYCAYREWIQAEMDFATALQKPIIGVELWGQERTPSEVRDAARVIVGWNTESIVAAIRDVCPTMVPRLIHVGFTVTPTVNPALIDGFMRSVSLDWCRYAWNCYLVWTMHDAETICSQIRQTPGLEAVDVVACALRHEDGYAYLPKFLWDWIRAKGLG
jgi:antiphage defense system Thoeris ThsB-like protein